MIYVIEPLCRKVDSNEIFRGILAYGDNGYILVGNADNYQGNDPAVLEFLEDEKRRIEDMEAQQKRAQAQTA